MTGTKRQPPQLVSVIMPNLNGEDTLEQQFDALAGQTYQGDWEVIVADNGSSDGSVDLVRAWKGRLPNLRLIHAERRGAGPARNVGAEAAEGDFLVFCDNDDVVQERWLEALAVAGRNHDLVGGVIEQELLNRESDYPRPDAPDDGLPRVLGRYHYVLAGNCGIWYDVFESLGGWNEAFSSSTEDEELSIRAFLAGYSLGFAPEAVLHYRHRDDLRSFVGQQFRYAREEVRLYRDFKYTGVRRNRLKTVCVAWAWLVWHIPDGFASGKTRADWLLKGATRVGRLWGSIKYRTLYL